MLSSFDIYLVMQLDAIVNFFVVVGGVGISLCVALCWFKFFVDGEFQETFKAVRPYAVVSILCVVASTFIPTSKTAAAMILLPALTSDQFVEPLTAEAKDLYKLAKQALQNVAEQKAEDAKPEPEAK